MRPAPLLRGIPPPLRAFPPAVPAPLPTARGVAPLRAILRGVPPPLRRLPSARVPPAPTTTAAGAAPAYPPAPAGGATPRIAADAASSRWVRLIVDVVNNLLRGKLNVTASLTLTAGADTTTLVDARIGASSALLFSPLSATAAAELATLYVSSQQGGQATVTHSNSGQTDRNFNVVIIG